MTQREFVRWLLFDTAAFCIILAALVGLILIGPGWTAGAIAFVGVPLVLVGFVGWATWTTRPSRRREKPFDQEDAPCPDQRGNGLALLSSGQPTCTDREAWR